ncbi:EAL domain-containing protein [Pokkaliibacter sp. CJK22405]|uniref:sensor domain-containing protein n=1 Tax=Pokkaliibacter sp. CJK22405 TaxID=3384615 RepID=UPI00398539A9
MSTSISFFEDLCARTCARTLFYCRLGISALGLLLSLLLCFLLETALPGYALCLFGSSALLTPWLNLRLTCLILLCLMVLSTLSAPLTPSYFAELLLISSLPLLLCLLSIWSRTKIRDYFAIHHQWQQLFGLMTEDDAHLFLLDNEQRIVFSQTNDKLQALFSQPEPAASQKHFSQYFNDPSQEILAAAKQHAQPLTDLRLTDASNRQWHCAILPLQLLGRAWQLVTLKPFFADDSTLMPSVEDHLLNRLPTGVFSVSRDWQLHFYNPAFIKLLGVSHEQANPSSFWDFMSELNDTQLALDLRRVMDESKGEERLCFIHPHSGKQLTLQLHACANGMMGYILDTEDSHLARQRVDELQTLLSHLEHQTHAGSWALSTSGKLQLSVSACLMLGVDEDHHHQEAHQFLLDCVVDADRLALLQVLRQAQQGIIKPFAQHVRLRRDAHADVQAFIWYGWGLGEGKGSIGTLQHASPPVAVMESEEWLARQSLDSLSSQICILDSKGSIVMSNEAWKRISAQLPGAPAPKAFQGMSFLEVCDRAASQNIPQAGSLAAGIRAVQTGRISSYQQRQRVEIYDQESWQWVRVEAIPTGNERFILVSYDDITEQQQQLQNSQLSAWRLQQVVDRAVQAFWVYCPKTQEFEYFSPGFERLIGFNEALILKPEERWHHWIHPRDKSYVQQCLHPLFNGHGELHDDRNGLVLEYRLLTAEQEIRWIRAHHYLVSGDQDSLVDSARLIAVLEDITLERQQQESVHQLSYFDQLTGLNNRASFHDRLRASCERKAPFYLFLMGLDRFKKINDSLGHEFGDELLYQLAQRLQLNLGTDTLLARVSGDEFAFVFSHQQIGDSLDFFSQNLLNQLNAPFLVKDQQVYVTGSLGIVQYPVDGDSPTSLLSNVDLALQLAKEQGIGKVYRYEASINNKAQLLASMRLLGELRQALRLREFILHYQPKKLLSDGTIVGVEALLRWQHPHRGLIPPAEFIPLLEESGLIVQVGQWALQRACEDLAMLRQQHPDFTVAVNVSSRQLHDERFVGQVEQLLQRYPHAQQHLEIEITESVMMQQPPEHIAALQSLQLQGVSITLDDFGTGYSSLSYLKQLPVTTLKIDRSFILDIHESPDSQNIISAIVSMAHAMNLTIVAEGVELDAQTLTLESLGCDQIQGFLLARPMSLDALLEWLEHYTQSE